MLMGWQWGTAVGVVGGVVWVGFAPDRWGGVYSICLYRFMHFFDAQIYLCKVK